MGTIIESILAGVIVNGLFLMLEGAVADIRNASLREKVSARKDELQSMIVTRISPIVRDLEDSDNWDHIESFLKSDDVSELIQRLLTREVHRSKGSLSSIREEFNAACLRYIGDIESSGVSGKLWWAILDGCEGFIKDAIDDEDLKMLASILTIQNEKTLIAVSDTSRKIDELPRRTAEELTKCGFGKDREPEYPVWDIKHLRNPNFTGREDLLRDLRQALTENHNAALIQMIRGLGGVGKTQLAVEYAYRYSDEYDIIWWLRSENPATIASDYARLAERLQLQVKDPENIPAMIDAVRTFLSHRTNWLLIFDNASDPDSIRNYLPATTTGHILITSRHQNWQCATEFPVEPFKRDESIEFIRERTGQDDEKVVNELVEELGDLPLALEQAGAFIKESGMPVRVYLEEYRETRLVLLEEGRPFDYPATVATTWEISFQKIRDAPKIGQVAEDLLNLCSFFAPDNIPLSVIVRGSEHLPPGLSQACQNDSLLYRTTRVIRKYSLMGGEGDSLFIHRLVQEVIRSRLERDAGQQWAGAAVQILDAAFPRGYANPQNWQKGSLLLPHTLSAASYAESLNSTSMELGQLLSCVGFYLHARAEFSESRKIYMRALKINEMFYGSDHPMVATDLNNLGAALQALGDLTGAKEHFERALVIHEKTCGPDHPDTAISVNNLGVVLQDLGDLLGAKEHFERALKINEMIYRLNQKEIATGFNNLGTVLQVLGDLLGAKEHFERALRINEKIYGPDHPTVAKNVSNLGRALQTLGDLPGAKEHLERALKINEMIYWPDHPAVAVDVNNLGLVLHDLGDLQGAREHFERALGISEKTYGPDHPEVAKNVNNLGRVLRDLRDLPVAREHFERALRINERTYGPDHPEVAKNVNNLGLVLFDLGDLRGARKHFERSLKIDEKTYGQDNPEVATDLNNLGAVLLQLGDLRGAREHFERALRIGEKIYGPDHPDVAKSISNLGLVLHYLGDLPVAREHFERALRINERTYGPDHPEVERNLYNLGMALKALGDLPRAKEHLKRALRISEKTYGPDTPEVGREVNVLGDILHELGGLPEAKEYFERALRISEKTDGPDSPEVALIISNLGSLAYELGDLLEAKEYFERALKISKKANGPDSPEVALIISNLGGILYKLGDPQKAKENYKRALKIVRKVYKPDHPTMKLIRDNLKSVNAEIKSQ